MAQQWVVEGLTARRYGRQHSIFHEPEAEAVTVEDGALMFRDQGALVVAFAAGSWCAVWPLGADDPEDD